MLNLCFQITFNRQGLIHKQPVRFNQVPNKTIKHFVVEQTSIPFIHSYLFGNSVNYKDKKSNMFSMIAPIGRMWNEKHNI